MIPIKNAVIFGLVIFISTACAGLPKLEQVQFLETITIDGKSYDIHTAREYDPELNTKKRVKVLVPKGVKPRITNTLASCSADKSDPECNQLFNKAVKTGVQPEEETDSSH